MGKGKKSIYVVIRDMNRIRKGREGRERKGKERKGLLLYLALRGEGGRQRRKGEGGILLCLSR